MRRSLLLCLALAGCADKSSRYPSLLPRPIEKTSLAEPAPSPVAPIAADPTLDGRIAVAVRKAADAETTFAKAADDAEAKVALARGTAEGSDAWLTAQVALAALDVARQPFVGLQADLEQLAVERATSGQPPYPALEKASADARAQVERVRARSATIEGSLAH
jgi:hypothetical protein